MKIKFLSPAPGRPEYAVGETYEFTGVIEESYAKKFMARGWAVPVDKTAKDHVEETAAVSEANSAREAKENAAYKASVERGDRGPKAGLAKR